MNILEGRLVGAKSGYVGHVVEALFSGRALTDVSPSAQPRTRGAAPRAKKGAAVAAATKPATSGGDAPPSLYRADVADDGRFLVELGDELLTGAVDVVVRAPSGERLAEVEMAADQPLEISVKPAPAIEVTPADPASTPVAPAIVRVTVLRKRDRAAAAGVLVSVWEETDGETTPRTVIGAAYADAEGRARVALPGRRLARLSVEIAGEPGGRRHPVPTDETGRAVEAMRIEADVVPPDSTQDGAAACDCEAEALPRAPDHEDLVGVDGVYASDLGGACVKLTTPNRTLEEYNFTTLVRTTDPVLWGVKPRPRSPLSQGALELIAKIALGASSIDAALKDNAAAAGTMRTRSRRLAGTDADRVAAGAEADDIRLSSEAYRNSGLLAARAWRETIDLDAAQKAIVKSASSFSEDVLRHALSDPDGFTPAALMTAERKHSFAMIKDQLATSIFGFSQRAPISATNSPQWEGNAHTYQAATIAHGHVLGFRQIWKADGYSLGDLLYSLPLGPGQKRKIVVLDWDRREAARRDETRVATEAFSADLSRDRDVAEIVSSTVTESIRAESNAHSWGAGGGIGLGIPIGAGFLGIGVAGGGGGAGSDAQQNSARAVAASSGQHLSDRTQQAAAAVRSQRGTVIASRTQSETVSVTSEVVANYNHCHAITIEYFEVLKHYRVEQDLVSVRECLFVPLHMSPFDDLKALRWRDTLHDFVFDHSLRPAFASVARLVNGYADADFPPGRYADEVVSEIWGDFGLELNIARPRPPAVNEAIEDYLDGAWAFWNALFGPGAAAQVYNTYIAGQELADQVFADELAPRLARTMIDNLSLKLVIDVGGGVATLPADTDFTLVSSYRPGREHLVSFKIRNLPNWVTRSMIRGIRIESSTDLSPNSQTIVRSVRCSYRNAYRSFAMISPRRVRDELRPGDQFYVSTRSLSRAEEFNPRANDIVLRDGLIKHLNEHVEHYHRLIWWRMDPGRRFMLLDGFIAPNSGGRSVASVTENRLLDIVGNCLVLPVAPGYALNPLLKPPEGSDKPVDLLEHYRPPLPVPPRRISVPTRGVHAEAIMGDCNSCEKHSDTRFWDWASEPIGDEPTEIGETSLDSRRQTPPGTTLTEFPQPIVAIQNAPAAPDPTGFAPLAALLGTSGLFTDITGLEGNQKNALAAFQGAMRTANAMGKLAASGAKTIHAQRNSERIMQKATEAHKKKQLNDKDAKTVVGATVGAVNGDQGKPKEKLTDDPAVKKGIDAVANGAGTRSMQVSSETGTTSQSVDVKFDGQAGAPPAVDFKVQGIVPTIAQLKSKGCWAAALTMLASWKRQQSLDIDVLLGEAGGEYLNKYNANAGLLPTEVNQLKADFGLRDASTALTATALADQLAARGPLWVVVDEDDSASFSVHARVVTGVSGDGTPRGTTIFYNDPADGSAKSEPLQAFVIKMEQLAQGIATTFGGPSLQILSN